MLELKPASEMSELGRLHAATCMSMTQFINGHQCPKLAQRIVRQLNQLVEHPELDQGSGTRNMYLQLREHWQKITTQLQEQRGNPKPTLVYH